MSSIAKKSFKTFIWTFVGSILGFLFQIIVAKYLGPDEYGRANVLLGLNGTFLVFLNFGLTTLIVKEAAITKESPEIILSKFADLYVLLDLLTFPLVFYLLKRLLEKASMYNFINIIIVLLLIYLNQFSNLFSSYLIGTRKQSTNAFLRNFLSRILNLTIFFIIYFFIGNYLSILIVQIISLFLIFLLFLLKLKITKINFKYFIHILREAWQFYLIGILYSLYNNISKYLQKLFVSDKVVGFLSLGMSLSIIGVMLGQVLANIMMPEFAESWYKKDFKKIDYFFKKVSRYNAYIILPIVLFVVTNIEKILGFLSEDYKKGSLIVSILLISSFFNSFVGPNGTLLNMSNKQKYEVFNGIALIATGWGLGLILGPRFEWGIALSIALSIIVVNILKFIEVGVLYKIYPYSLKNFIYLLLFNIPVFFSFQFAKMIENMVLYILVNILILIFTIISIFYFSTENEDRKFLKNLIRKYLKH